MIIQLNKELYELTKTVDFSRLNGHILFNDNDLSVELDDQDVTQIDFFGDEYTLPPIKVMLGCISDEVTATGLSDNQDKVLPRGRALYELYDSIYYSL